MSLMGGFSHVFGYITDNHKKNKQRQIGTHDGSYRTNNTGYLIKCHPKRLSKDINSVCPLFLLHISLQNIQKSLLRLDWDYLYMNQRWKRINKNLYNTGFENLVTKESLIETFCNLITRK